MIKLNKLFVYLLYISIYVTSSYSCADKDENKSNNLQGGLKRKESPTEDSVSNTNKHQKFSLNRFSESSQQNTNSQRSELAHLAKPGARRGPLGIAPMGNSILKTDGDSTSAFQPYSQSRQQNNNQINDNQQQSANIVSTNRQPFNGNNNIDDVYSTINQDKDGINILQVRQKRKEPPIADESAADENFLIESWHSLLNEMQLYVLQHLDLFTIVEASRANKMIHFLTKESGLIENAIKGEYPYIYKLFLLTVTRIDENNKTISTVTINKSKMHLYRTLQKASLQTKGIPNSIRGFVGIDILLGYTLELKDQSILMAIGNERAIEARNRKTKNYSWNINNNADARGHRDFLGKKRSTKTPEDIKEIMAIDDLLIERGDNTVVDRKYFGLKNGHNDYTKSSEKFEIYKKWYDTVTTKNQIKMHRLSDFLYTKNSFEMKNSKQKYEFLTEALFEYNPQQALTLQAYCLLFGICGFTQDIKEAHAMIKKYGLHFFQASCKIPPNVINDYIVNIKDRVS